MHHSINPSRLNLSGSLLEVCPSLLYLYYLSPMKIMYAYVFGDVIPTTGDSNMRTRTPKMLSLLALLGTRTHYLLCGGGTARLSSLPRSDHHAQTPCLALAQTLCYIDMTYPLKCYREWVELKRYGNPNPKDPTFCSLVFAPSSARRYKNKYTHIYGTRIYFIHWIGLQLLSHKISEPTSETTISLSTSTITTCTKSINRIRTIKLV